MKKETFPLLYEQSVTGRYGVDLETPPNSENRTGQPQFLFIHRRQGRGDGGEYGHRVPECFEYHAGHRDCG